MASNVGGEGDCIYESFSNNVNLSPEAEEMMDEMIVTTPNLDVIEEDE